MASNSEAIGILKVFVDQDLSPEAFSAFFAAEAIKFREESIAADIFSPHYDTYVDGREGALETTARREILYKGKDELGAATQAVLDYVVKLSPVGRAGKDRVSGVFRAAWFVTVNGQVWGGNLEDIPSDSKVLVVNPMPYARKIESGGLVTNKAPFITRAAQAKLSPQFTNVNIESKFVNIPPGIVTLARRYGSVPYILKGHQRTHGLSYSKKNKGFIRVRQAGPTNARDRRVGEELTYPAISLIASEGR